jgi:hypothetical protein
MKTKLWRGAMAFSAATVLLLVAAQIASAEDPQQGTSPMPRQVNEQRPASAERPKQQVIYNLNNGSQQNAEILHGQSKAAADASLPIDPTMPISLQLARAKANAVSQAAVQSSQAPAAPNAKQEHSVRKQKNASLRKGGRPSVSKHEPADAAREKSKRHDRGKP